MRNNPNNQNPVASLVEENVPSEQWRVGDAISRCVNVAKPAIVVLASTALAFGISVGVTRDPSQCILPPVVTAIASSAILATVKSVNASLEAFRLELNPVSSASIAQSANSALVVEGIPVSSVLPSAPEFNLASGVPSPRSSLDLEGGAVSRQNSTNPINQNNVNADLVFSV